MAKSLAKSGALASLCVMYGAVAAFAAQLVVSNGFGAQGSGTFFQIMALLTVGTSLAVFGADTGLVRIISAQVAVGRGSAVRSLLKFAVIPAVLFAFIIASSSLIYALPALTPDMPQVYRAVLYVSAPFIVASALMTLCFGALRGLQQVVTFTVLQNVLLPSLRLLAVVAVVALGAGFVYLALAWSLPVLLVLAVAGYLVFRYLPRTADTVQADAIVAETAKTFWGFSSARGVATIVESILEWIDVMLITAFMGVAAGGIYGAVNRYVRVGAMVEHTARMVTGPAISASLATGATDRARTIFVNTTRVLVAIAWPFYLTMMFFGPALLSFFGSEFTEAAPIFWIICSAMMLAAAAGGVQSVLLMSGKSRWQLYNKLSSLAVALVLNLLLIPAWGLAGAATAWAAAVLTDTSLAAYQVFKHGGIRASVAELAPAVILSLTVVGGGAGLVSLLVGQHVTGLLVHLVVVLGLYGLLVLKMRKKLGIASFLTSRKKH
ncbi:lipopolysaccharide biosynthesis protein [Rothia sp. ZJ1223]|uniref:lipopolysaccharide biosynthesis protein n=1 Tax=Rothia sp. ZJ1223 TaxID=2811098 RepID=UPI00195BE834|nr:polysaccharide biosynthesis C-terminal domain-containing protein [Rothia sp. ZJ1223]MBM7051384.1 polysaccharide biosynthesis C-terminal domain-containing protein [Rothia sp. ZJ1223]